jgi:hypothetical protein
MVGALVSLGLLLTGWAILPGVATARLFAPAPSRHRAASRLAVGLVAGLAWWTLASEAVTVTIGLTSRTSVAGAAVSALVSSVVIVLTRGRRPGPVGDRQARVALFAVVAVAVVAVVPMISLAVGRPDSLISSTSWYYWQLARLVIGPHGIPAHVNEWGTRVSFLSDDIGFNTLTASIAAPLNSGHDLLAAQAVRVVVALLTTLGAGLLVLVWRGRVLAAAAAVLATAALSTVVTKLSSYRPESAGYGLLLLLPAVLTVALELSNPSSDETARRPAWVPVVVTAAGFLALSQIHGITWAFGGLLLGGTFAAHLVHRRNKAAVVAVGLTGAVIVGVWLVGALALTGRAFVGDQLSSLPRPGPGQSDPTWVFHQIVQNHPLPVGHPPNSLQLAQQSLAEGFIFSPSWIYFGLGAAALVGTLYAAVVRPRRGLPLLVFVLCALAGGAAVSLLFALGWDTYVPHRTAATRIGHLIAFLVPITLAVMPAARSPHRLARIGRVVALVVAVVVWVRSVPAADNLRRLQPSRDHLAYARRVDLPSSARVLANAYTEGYIPMRLGGHGVLDGRAPYTIAPLLYRANRLVQESRDYFADPSRHADILDRERVDYVLVGRRRWSLGSAFMFATNTRALRSSPRLVLVEANPAFLMFRVVPPS